MLFFLIFSTGLTQPNEIGKKKEILNETFSTNEKEIRMGKIYKTNDALDPVIKWRVTEKALLAGACLCEQFPRVAAGGHEVSA